MNYIKRNIIPIGCLLIISIFFIGCNKKDYITGGSTANPKVNVSTYDYLKSNSLQQFDTLLLLIDKAGLKDFINQAGVTFFAPNDYSIFSYLNARTIKAQSGNPNAKYTLDSMFKYDIPRITDSLKMYVINEALTYGKLTENGAKYATSLAGNTAVISYESTINTSLGYTESVSSIPRVIYFTQLWKPLPEPFVASEIPNNIGVRTLCKTSGIQTNTGVIHVLNSSHTLFFYGTRMP